MSATGLGGKFSLPLLAAITAGLATLQGCNPVIGEVVRPSRLPPIGMCEAPREARTPGSLWTASASGNILVTDHRGIQACDLVMVLVSENADARRGAATDLSRDSSMSNSITDLAAILKYLQPGLMGAELAGGKSGSDFSGAGETSRTEKLTARITATVKRVLPNGNLFIEGEREVLVNREINVLYVSGIIRPVDIDEHNTVESARIAEAQIEFNGRGVISDKQGPGFLTRAIDQYNPF